LELRDRETEGRTRRVAEITVNLACSMGISRDKLVHIRRGALLPDIGKMGIPDRILQKPGPLTEVWEIMRLHPFYGYEMLVHIAYLQPALDIPYCHHEHWDGTGYPRGLKGEADPSFGLHLLCGRWVGYPQFEPRLSCCMAGKGRAGLYPFTGRQAVRSEGRREYI